MRYLAVIGINQSRKESSECASALTPSLMVIVMNSILLIELMDGLGFINLLLLDSLVCGILRGERIDYE